MNSIWPSAVTVSNSSRENSPFSPTSMNTPSSALPSSHHGRASGRNASASGTGEGQSTSGIGFPLRRIGPNPISRQAIVAVGLRSEEHTSELQSRRDLVCRLLLEKKKKKKKTLNLENKKKKKL